MLFFNIYFLSIPHFSVKRENKSNGTIYLYGGTPQLGTIVCWDRYDPDRGHIAVVKAINGDSVTIPTSHYSRTYFDTHTISSNSSNDLTSMSFFGNVI